MASGSSVFPARKPRDLGKQEGREKEEREGIDRGRGMGGRKSVGDGVGEDADWVALRTTSVNSLWLIAPKQRGWRY